MLVLLNITMKPSNLRKKKIKEPLYVIKKIVKCNIGTAQCDNGTVKCEEKKKETTKCDKRIVKCDVGTVQCEDGTVKCEKKVREPPNVKKELSHVILVLCNVRIVP